MLLYTVDFTYAPHSSSKCLQVLSAPCWTRLYVHQLVTMESARACLHASKVLSLLDGVLSKSESTDDMARSFCTLNGWKTRAR